MPDVQTQTWDSEDEEYIDYNPFVSKPVNRRFMVDSFIVDGISRDVSRMGKFVSSTPAGAALKAANLLFRNADHVEGEITMRELYNDVISKKFSFLATRETNVEIPEPVEHPPKTNEHTAPTIWQKYLGRLSFRWFR